MKQNGQDNKKEAEYKNLAVACEILSVELQKSLGAESLKEQLAETKLSQVSGWLNDIAVQATRMLMGFMVDGERRHDLVCAKLQAIKMPELSDENAYRKAGVQSVKSLAELSNQLDSDRKQLRDLRTALSKLKSSKFALDGGAPVLPVLEEWEKQHGRDPLKPRQAEEESEAVSKVASCHVAVVASLCLVRSDAVKGGSADGKVLKNLEDVTSTLRAKVDCLPKTCEPLLKQATALLQECESFSKKGTKRPPAGASKPSDKAAKKQQDRQPQVPEPAQTSEGVAVVVPKSMEEPSPKTQQVQNDSVPNNRELPEEKAPVPSAKESKSKRDENSDSSSSDSSDTSSRKKKKEKKQKNKKDKKKKKKEKKTKKKDKKTGKDKKSKKDKKTKADNASDADRRLSEKQIRKKLRERLWTSPSKQKKAKQEAAAVEAGPKAKAKAKAQAKAEVKAKAKAKVKAGAKGKAKAVK